MRSRLSLVVLAASLLAAPVFAQDDAPAGLWDGVLVRNGAQAPLAITLTQRGDVWRGWLEVNGASSPLEGVRVAGNIVHFDMPGQGVFHGTYSGDSMTGSVSGSDSPGSFSLKRKHSPDEHLDTP